MKKYFSFIIILAMTVSFTFSQNTIKVESSTKISVSQKYGPTITEGTYTLEIIYDDDEIKFRTKDEQAFSTFTLKKTTKKYLIGEESGNYCFYNFADKQFFYIDYFMSRYTVGAYGEDYSSLKESALKMMEMLKEEKTQKDVIAHLIKQAEYDF